MSKDYNFEGKIPGLNVRVSPLQEAIETRRTQGNYVNNDAGAFVEIEIIKQRLDKIEIFMSDLRGEMVNAIIGFRDATFFQDKLDEYGAERFDLNKRLTLLK